MTINWQRTILASIVGTLVFDLMGLLLTGQWWDIPGLLGIKLGLGVAGGVVAHYANGALLAIIYIGIAPFLWGPSWVRALTYITVETVFGVWLFMLPLLDLGVAGVNASAMFRVITLVRHWGYGVVLGWLAPVPQAAPASAAAHSQTVGAR